MGVMIRTRQLDDLIKGGNFLYEGKVYRVDTFFPTSVSCTEIEEYGTYEFSRYLIVKELVVLPSQ